MECLGCEEEVGPAVVAASKVGGQEALFSKTDADLVHAVATTLAQCSRGNVFLSYAALMPFPPLLGTDPADWDCVLTSNW